VTRRRGVPLAVLLTAFSAACATLRGGRGAACEPVSGALAADASVGAMAGDFRLTVVATRGAAAGQVAAASLHLEMSPEPLPMAGARDVRMELLGTTDLAPESVGAVNLGGLNQSDPSAPGVGVVVQRVAGSPPSVTIRVGSAGTRRDVLQFDGGYFALFVARLDGRGFAGSWRSALPGESQAGGHFCAVRVGS